MRSSETARILALIGSVCAIGRSVTVDIAGLKITWRFNAGAPLRNPPFLDYRSHILIDLDVVPAAMDRRQRRICQPADLGWIITAIGAAIVIGCMFEFAWRGIGTPAPIDPPRRLVISGLYRWVRNPM